MEQLKTKPQNEDRLVLWQTIALVVATLAAIASIFFGVYQFQSQQQSADLVAHANIKPLLDTLGEKTEDSRSIALINYGIGSAIITSVKFTRISDGNWSNCCIADLFDDEIRHDQIFTFWSGDSYLEPGGKILLLSITRNHLEDHGLDSAQINHMLRSWDAQIANITVKITYTDVLGERQNDLSSNCGEPWKIGSG
jgi:hypothetical protein